MKPTEQPRLVLSTQYTRRGALHPLRRATPDVGRCTRYGALHPLWGAAPDQKRCNAHGSGAVPKATSTFAAPQSHQSSADEHTTTSHKRYTLYVALHPMWGATPVMGRCTRCGALHPIRRGAMLTDQVQRPRQQAFSRPRNHTNHQPTSTPPPPQVFSRTRTTHLIPHRHTCRPHLEHLPLWV